MSKSSRDLSKGIAVKSNGFKYGGGSAEGWGTNQSKGKRLGKGQGERDVTARKKLRERLEKLRSEAASTAGGAEEGGNVLVGGRKRKRVGGGGGGKKKTRGDGSSGNKAPESETTAAKAAGGEARTKDVDDRGEAVAEEEEEKEEDARTDEKRYTCETCGVKCGSKANFDNHCDSKKHKAARQREKGKAILAALRPGKK